MGRHWSIWYASVRGVVGGLFFRLLTGGLASKDERRVPREGAVILASNHLSHLDPPAVACGTKRQLVFMAKEELFKGVVGRLIRSLGAFPVKRGETDTESIRKSIELLTQGRALLIFPEGTRGDGIRLGRMNRGVAMLAKKTGASVVPVGIVGSQLVMPSGSKGLHRHKITLAFGEPFTYESVAIHDTEKQNREQFSQELARRIAALCTANGLTLEAE